MAVEAELLLWSETRNNMPTEISLDNVSDERMKKWQDIIESIRTRTRTPQDEQDDEPFDKPEPLLKEVSKQKSLDDLLDIKEKLDYKNCYQN